MTICDIEGNWNRNTRRSFLRHPPDRRHPDQRHRLEEPRDGRAGRDNLHSRSRGTAGISHGARAVVQSTVVNGVFNAAAAINNAASTLKAGDVILDEGPATGPNGKYIANAVPGATSSRQSWQPPPKASPSSKLPATATRTSILPSSTGPACRKTAARSSWERAFRRPTISTPTAHTNRIGVPRSRIWFSNYGKIVNVHAWGWHVTTLGYGDAQGGASENTWYTLGFSGTSSASPIVTGSVACLQGRSKSKNGAPMTPAKVRKILMATGTPQEAGAGRAADPEHRAAAESPKGDGAGVRMRGRDDPRGPSAEGRQRPAHHRLHAECRGGSFDTRRLHLQVRTGRDILAPLGDLPKGSRIVYKVPSLARADAKRSSTSTNEPCGATCKSSCLAASRPTSIFRLFAAGPRLRRPASVPR